MNKKQSPDLDYKKFYNLEDYLFTEVRNNFLSRRFLIAEEFFCIVIWKANRSKGKMKDKLKGLGKDIHNAIKTITGNLFVKDSHKERLKYLLRDCKLQLSTATAILTVLYPEYFTVYDVRVCGELKNFHNLKNRTNFEKIWNEYMSFKDAVINAVPNENTLRDKDRWLWGKSFCKGLNNFINE